MFCRPAGPGTGRGSSPGSGRCDGRRGTGRRDSSSPPVTRHPPHPAEAEPLLQECLAIREKGTPDEWWTPFTVSYRGEALARQSKYREAEPLLVAGFDRLAKFAMPPGGETRIQDRWRATAKQLARLYEATGKPGEAAKWRVEAAKYLFLAPPPRVLTR